MILLYHKVHPEAKSLWWVDCDRFHRHLLTLRSRKVVYLDDYDRSDPQQVVITFDGIYRNVLEYAAPLLEKFGYPYELFLSGAHVGKDNEFDAVEPPASFCNEAELAELVARGGRLQWHSWSHTNLKEATDSEMIRRELTVPDSLRSLDPAGFRWFAYPHGDFNDAVVAETKRCFTGGLSCVQGSSEDRFTWNRLTVTSETDIRPRPLVSVIIASYNYGRYLAEAVESVVGQSQLPDEILIVDDASDDETSDVGRIFAQRHPELIRFHRNERNLGIVENFNRAVAATSGDYVCILGADNRMRGDYVEQLAGCLDRNAQAAVAYSDFALFGSRARLLYGQFPMERRGRIIADTFYEIVFPDFTAAARDSLKTGNFIHGSSMFRRNAFEAVGGYVVESERPEDHSLFLRMVRAGWSAVRCGQPLLEYRQHSREQANVQHTAGRMAEFYRERSDELERQLDQAIAWAKSLDQDVAHARQAHSALHDAHQKIVDRARSLEVDLGRVATEHAEVVARAGMLEQELATAKRRLDDVLSSRSWRITAPLRVLAASVRQKRVIASARAIAARSARSGYRRLPLSDESKRKLKSWLFTSFPRLFRTTVAFQQWQAFQKESVLLRSVSFDRPSPARALGSTSTAGALQVPKHPDASYPPQWDHPLPAANGYWEWSDYAAIRQHVTEGERRLRESENVEPCAILDFPDGELGRHIEQLAFPATPNPAVTLLIPTYGNLKYTVECLTSILASPPRVSYEVLIADDASTDGTPERLADVPNLRLLSNTENLNFLGNVNRALPHVRGKYVVLLNNDVQACAGWLDNMVAAVERNERVGAVGPCIVYPSGHLQEAGCAFRPDCTSEMVGLGQSASLPQFSYPRQVDYSSGACLLVRTQLFRDVGGFSPEFSPAYCEDTDLCLKLRAAGFTVTYEPKARVVHHLSKTTASQDQARKLSLVGRNLDRFARKWQATIDAVSDVRIICFYLPQFHAIPENDRWWGRGFTEWRNVAKAKPNFVGHYQPRQPADLGYYDLHAADVMDRQAELARRYGIGGFCYYYYRFAGKRLLEMPLERLIKTGKPDLPFCLCWANENWTRRWDGQDQEILMAQRHSHDDDTAVIVDLIRYMRLPHYIRIHGKPLLVVYRVDLFPDFKQTSATWRRVCHEHGLGEIYLAMVESFDMVFNPTHPSKYGCDAAIEFPPHGMSASRAPSGQVLNPNFSGQVADYRELAVRYCLRPPVPYTRLRGIMPGWDNTARRQNNSFCFENSTPGAFQAWAESIIDQTRNLRCGDERIVFVNAWNEWAEGAYLEPDLRFGHGYLEAIKNAKDSALLKRRSRYMLG